jgi:hypothetical protein
MIQRALFTCLGFTVFGVLVPSTRADWIKFTSPDKTFEAQFPSEPRTTEQKAPGATTKMFIAMEGTTTYNISVTPVPGLAKGDADTVAKTFDTSRDQLIKALNGKLLSEKKLELDNKHPGREFIVEAVGGAVHLRQRMYIVEGVLYQVVVGGTSADAINGKDANMFVDSFKLKK